MLKFINLVEKIDFSRVRRRVFSIYTCKKGDTRSRSTVRTVALIDATIFVSTEATKVARFI